MKKYYNNNRSGRNIYYVILIFILLIIIYIYITLCPSQITYILDSEYQKISSMMENANDLYHSNKKKESFIYYKNILHKCKNSYWTIKNNIFHTMSKNYKNEKYYYEFLEEILQNQFIEGKGRNYDYCISNPFKLALYMLDVNTTHTQQIFSKIPKKQIEEYPGLDTAWYYVMKKGAFAPEASKPQLPGDPR